MSFARKRQAAAVAIAKADPQMRSIIKHVGDCSLTLRRNRLHMLTRSIVGQQLSTKAARTIYGRFCELLPRDYTAEDILSLGEEAIRRVGVSRNKYGTITRIASATAAGDLPLNRMGRMDNEVIIESMVEIKGIGVWTAQMFLIFSLGRLDVLPHTDLGIRAAFKQIYNLPELPGNNEMTDLAGPWLEYASIGSWYCWRALDMKVFG